MRRTDSLEKTSMMEKIESNRRREQQRKSWFHQLNGLEFEQTLETVKDRETWHTAINRHAESDTS